LASGNAPQTYRWALALGLLVPVIAGALGYLAFAFVAAALVVPAIYVVYMYDVNEWEDQPIPVVLGGIGLAAALGVAFTFLWHGWILSDDLAPVDFGEGVPAIRWSSLLVMVLLVPVVSEVLKQLGPLFLATRPRFDDMIDALTFGVAAGASFAAAETIVVNRGLFSSFGQLDDANSGFWVSLILSAAIVKPIVYGAATGIALAAWSGLGSGYDGFKPGYFRGLGEALLANILFQAGLFFAARLEGTTGATVGLVWGAIVAAVLVVRLRYLLHFAVLEAALEASSSGAALKDSSRGTAWCPSCEMPLVEGANFCVVCGTSVRAGSKITRTRNRTDDAAIEGTSPTKPALAPTPDGVAPRDTKKTALVVGSVLATILIGGAVGQAAAATDEEVAPDDVPVVVVPEVGAGPTTDDPPEPAPAPGPTPDPTESADAAGSRLDGGSFGAQAAAALGSFGRADGGTTTTTGTTVDLGNGIGFEVPEGFEIEVNEPGYGQVFGQGGYFIAYLTAPPTDLQTIVVDHLEGLQGLGIQDLQISEPEAVELPTSAVVSAATLGYVGVLASQQGGSIPVQGFAYYFVLQDGTGVTAFGLFQQGSIDSADHPLVQGYNAMLNSLVGSF
jgi:RsiW-degrading membrane proteinase PrsW (M82 family)